MPQAPRVPRKERTPLVDHLLECVRAQKREAQQQRNNYLKKSEEVRRLKQQQIHKASEAVDFLQDKISPRFFKWLQAEVRNFARKPQGRRWTREELADFECVRQRGPGVFVALPNIKPTRKTLRDARAKLHLKPGINPHIMQVLKKKMEAMPPRERICYSVFDEMSLRLFLQLHRSSGLVSGYVDLGALGRRPELADEVMVVMIRSVYGKWKLPTAFWFTERKLIADDFAKIFWQANHALLEAGVDLRAQVCDGLQKNRSAEHMLGASYDRPWYFINNKKIVTLVDVPHESPTWPNA